MLYVENQTRNVVLVNEGRVADNPWTRFKGLIGVRQLSEGDGLLIKPCKGVHCMFMSIPIDVIYLDKDNQVVGLDPDMQPWRMGRIYAKSRAVLELPAGTIAKSNTQLMDQLRIRLS